MVLWCLVSGRVGHLVMFNVTGSGRGMNYGDFLRNVALSTDSRAVVL